MLGEKEIQVYRGFHGAFKHRSLVLQYAKGLRWAPKEKDQDPNGWLYVISIQKLSPNKI
jgi:hypothetical protein